MQNEPSGSYFPNISDYEISPRPRGANYQIVAADLPNAINAGLSANQAYKIYQDAGVGIQRQRFLELYKQTNAELTSNRAPTGISPTDIPLDSNLTDWNRAQLEGKSEYRYKEEVQIAFFDTTTGEVVTKLHAVYHNEPLTVAEIQSEALAFYADESIAAAYQREALSASMFRSFINSNFVTTVEK